MLSTGKKGKRDYEEIIRNVYYYFGKRQIIHTFTPSNQKKDAIRHPLTLAYIWWNLAAPWQQFCFRQNMYIYWFNGVNICIIWHLRLFCKRSICPSANMKCRRCRHEANLQKQIYEAKRSECAARHASLAKRLHV